MSELPTSYRVDAVLPELDDTTTIILRPQDGTPPPFKPGQFAMLSVFGNTEVPISISRIGDGELHHTVRAVGSGSTALTNLKSDDIVGLRGPFGTVWPVEEAYGKDLLIVAGGLGLAPLRPVIDQAIAQRDAFKRVSVLYGTREPAQLLYPQEYDNWMEALELLITVDHAERESGPPWRGNVGVITKLIGKAEYDPANTVAFVCGPEIMMRFCGRDLEAVGVPADQIHLSLERNMQCAVGLCGHCQYSNHFVCRDGAVLPYSRLAHQLTVREL